METCVEFLIPTRINSYNSLKNYLKENVKDTDLIITNECILKPHIGNQNLGCDILYQEKFGEGEPNNEMTDRMLNVLKDKKYDRIIAIGGGTIIDIAKLFLFDDKFNTETIFEKGEKLQKKRKLIAIPTTCGTGSEVTKISIVEFKNRKSKLGIAIPQMFPDEAILIPSLLKSIPFEVFVTSSIDALIHSIESFISPKANNFTRAFGRRAMEIIIQGYKEIIDNGLSFPNNLQEYLEASTLAGISFGNAGCGGVHALSYPIGAIYHIPHGKANYLVFQGVIEKYKELNADLKDLENILSGILNCKSEEIWEKMEEILEKLIIRQPLSSIGINRRKAEEMAESVFRDQQRLLANNPVQFTQEDIYQIYLNCI